VKALFIRLRTNHVGIGFEHIFGLFLKRSVDLIGILEVLRIIVERGRTADSKIT
jgi:hypothetical protein